MISKEISKLIPPKEDPFALVNEIKEREKKIGKEKVINATIGAIYDEKEEFFVYNTVKKNYLKIDKVDLFSYAGISGSLEYRESVKKFVFGKELKNIKSNIAVTATSGGTGAIFMTFKLYSEKDDTILLPNYVWGACFQLAEASGSKCETYNLFKNDKFDLDDFKSKVNNILKKQDRIVILINDPCHNPTGYYLTDEEWESIISFLKTINSKKKIILLNDIAYFEYDYRGYDKSRKHFSKFSNLPENILVLIAFSISKMLTSYGLRTGALIAISKSKKIIDDFTSFSSYICRSTWSNISRGAMALFVKIFNDKTLYEEYTKEKDKMINLLKKRTDLFINTAKKEKLSFLPYKSGFFITIELKKSEVSKVTEKLKSKDVYIIPLPTGIRIAICSVPTKKIVNLVKILKSVIK